MEGEDVRDAQRKLNARRAHMLDESGNLAKKIVDNGKFDNETEKAVVLFQRRNLLDPDGKIGDCTWNALNTIIAVATVTAKPGPQFRPYLDRMIDEAEKALAREQGRMSLRMREPNSQDQSSSRHFSYTPPSPERGFDRRVYNIQGQSGRTLQPFEYWTRADRWNAKRPPSYYNRALQIAMVSRTSENDRHVEYGPFLQLQQNWADPRWSIMAGYQIMYADIWHLKAFHLASLYAQPSWTLPRDPALAIGYQASIDLSKKGNLSFFIQGQAAASIDIETWRLSIGSSALGLSVAAGVGINYPVHNRPKNRNDFWNWW